ncbi:MAG TPA: quinolinate synthase NadA [Methanospirillum sp.]|nr:quinolinate synthase NadA [Methanospirillum sp.]
MTQDLNADILRLKREKNALILAHNYQSSSIHAVSDVIGDSLELALKARDAEEDLLIVCGVRFMAETAKILNTEKKVLIPVPDAGCPLADFLTPAQIEEAKKAFPGAPVVVYVNSTTEVKAVADITCTSGNAVAVVRSLPERVILFGPDSNLARFVQQQLPDKEIIPIPKGGHCYVHQSFTREDIRKAREIGGKIIAHPECPDDIRRESDFVVSTGKMIHLVQQGEIWHIFTEQGMVNRLKTLFPDKRFYQYENAVCKDMRKTTDIDLLSCMEHLTGEIILDDRLIHAARRSLDRMLAVPG